ncbi:DNA (cytosine-5)-methyltransferase 1 [Gonapodya sp. JEL0774]|nr:DNA (cytosine-5)-methyltransferase 1 [Gonapodya sp. JEL0774]
MASGSGNARNRDPEKVLNEYPQFKPYVKLLGAAVVAEAIEGNNTTEEALEDIEKLAACLKPFKASGPRAKRGGGPKSSTRGRATNVPSDVSDSGSAKSVPGRNGKVDGGKSDGEEGESPEDYITVSSDSEMRGQSKDGANQSRRRSPQKRRAAVDSDDDGKSSKRLRSRTEADEMSSDPDATIPGTSASATKGKRNLKKRAKSTPSYTEDGVEDAPPSRSRTSTLKVPTYRPKKPVVYQPREGEPVETGDTIVMGESGEVPDEDDPGIPCRRLYNFSIYDDKKKRMIYVEDVGVEERVDPCFSGIVRPVFADGESDEEFDDEFSDDEPESESEAGDFSSAMDVDALPEIGVDHKGKGKAVEPPPPVDRKGKGKAVEDVAPTAAPAGQWMKSSSLWHLEIHYPETGHGMWLKTEFAYYRLVQPSKAYTPFFEKISKAVRIAWRLIITLRRSKDTSYEEFLECLSDFQKLPPPPNGGSSGAVGDNPNTMELEEEARYPLDLTEKDLRDNIDWIRNEVEAEIEQYVNSLDDFTTMDLELLSSPLWKKIMSLSGSKRAPQPARDRAPRAPKELHVFKRNAVVSPDIRKLEGRLFGSNVTELPRPPVASAGLAVKHASPTKRALVRSAVENGVELNSTGDGKATVRAKAAKKENGNESDDEPPVIDHNNLYAMPTIPPLPDVDVYNIKWLSDCIGRDGDRAYYSSVQINGEMDLLEVGNYVITRPEEKSAAEAKSEGWLGVIKYLYEHKKTAEKKAHVRWFNPLKDTFVGELAGHAGKLEGTREIVLADSCADISLGAVCGVANVEYFDRDQQPPAWAKVRWDQGSEDDRYNFFYRYHSGFDDDVVRYTDAKRHEMSDPPADSVSNTCRKHEWCECCNSKTLKRRDTVEAHLIRSDGSENVVGVRVKGMPIFLHDYVYVDSGEKETPFRIGLVESFRSPKSKLVIGSDNGTRALRVDWSEDVAKTGIRVKLRMLRRADEILHMRKSREAKRREQTVLDSLPEDEHQMRDMRHLFFTNDFENIDLSKLSGVCWVSHRSVIGESEEALTQYKLEDVNNFWVGEKLVSSDKTEPLPASAYQFSVRRQRIREFESKLKDSYQRSAHKPLKAMDLFAGCGGLTCGLELSGALETLWAVECDVAAAMTFKKNFPQATVFNQDINILLERAWKRDKLNDPHPDRLKSADGQYIDDLPPAGSVEFLYGGPPCQGFSRMNRWKKVDDMKNALIPTFMSFVDMYNHPNFKGFLVENVADILLFKPGGVQVGVNKMEGGVEQGVVKFMVRAALDMDFEVSVVILQAAYHGVPQNRRRCFVQGYRRGEKTTLPDWPKPFHCMEGASAKRSSGGTTKISSCHGGEDTSFNYYDGFAGAPHRALTIRDTCSDLPGFEYTNPYKVIPATEENKCYDQDRKKLFPSYSEDVILREGYGGEMHQPFPKKPLTLYQSRIRNGATTLHNHVVKLYKSIVTERVCCVGMYPGADHHSLPKELAGETLYCLQGEGSAKDKHNGWKGLYGRLDYDKAFKTITTDVNPVNVQGTVLHPTQRRVVSVRENARAQGFPDTFVFCATTMVRQGSELPVVKDMYRQIGNAVPVPLAEAIGSKIKDAMFNSWERTQGHVGHVWKEGGRPTGKETAAETQEEEPVDTGDEMEE